MFVEANIVVLIVRISGRIVRGRLLKSAFVQQPPAFNELLLARLVALE